MIYRKFFTLVELMVAVFILATVGVLLMKNANDSTKQLAEASLRAKKGQLIQEAIVLAQANREEGVQSWQGEFEDQSGYLWMADEEDFLVREGLTVKRCEIRILFNDEETASVVRWR